VRSIFLIFFILFFVSCAKTKPEETAQAIDLAQTYLSDSKCQDAIEVLEDVGRDTENAIYLQVLASAYACRAGYSELSFISTDIPLIDASSSTELFKSLSLLSLSDETETDSDNYSDINTALSLLLDTDGGTQPSHAGRNSAFGPRKAGDMDVQVLLLSVAQLGKFLNHYANVDTTGVKGAGSTGTNSCFLNYTDSNAQNIVTALPVTNNCNSNVDGHPDLDLSTDAGKRRVCEGLILFTNIIDILENIDLSSSDSLGGLQGIADVVTAFKTTAITANVDLTTLLNTTSLSECETLMDDAAESNHMQIIYSLIFETGLE